MPGLLRERLADRAEHDLVIERFLDEVGDVGMHRLDRERDVGMASDRDHRGVRAVALHFRDQLGAIDDWSHHLEKINAFWSSVMLTSGRYKGQPMVAHVGHEQAMQPENFARRLALWRQTSAEFLAPELAAAFQEKADRIAESLQLGVPFHRERYAA